jgi:hypothetical protein
MERFRRLLIVPIVPVCASGLEISFVAWRPCTRVSLFPGARVWTFSAN